MILCLTLYKKSRLFFKGRLFSIVLNIKLLV